MIQSEEGIENFSECKRMQKNPHEWKWVGAEGKHLSIQIEFPYWEWIFLRCFESLDQGLGYQILSNI